MGRITQEGPIKVTTTDIASASQSRVVAPRSAPIMLGFGVIPLVLLIYSFLLPPEARLNVSDIALPAYRLIILAFLPLIFTRWASGSEKFLAVDLLVALASIWQIVSFVVFYGFADGFVRASGLVIDGTGAYFLARTVIRNPTDLRRFLIFIAPALCFAGLVMAAESLLGRLFWRPAFISLFGSLPRYADGIAVTDLVIRTEVRLGLLRGIGPFSHPILGGVILASAIPLFMFSMVRSWPRLLGVGAGLLAFFSLSSAAILSIVIAAGIYGYDKIQSWFQGLNWRLFLAFGSFALVVMHFASNSGLPSVLARMTLNPQTGYMRLLIWEYGWKTIMTYPLFGIGHSDYLRLNWMPPSVDAHFIMLGIRHGLFVPVVLFAAMLLAMFQLGSRLHAFDRLDGALAKGAIGSLVIMIVAAMSVSYYGEAVPWLMIIFGIVAALYSNAVAPGRILDPVE